MTSEELMKSAFGTFRHCTHKFTRYLKGECIGHVGMDERRVHMRFGPRVMTTRVAAMQFVVVHPDHRRQGIGKSLMEIAHWSALEQHIPYAMLYTDVPGFYEACGYEKTRIPRVMVRSIYSTRSWPPFPFEIVGEPW